MSRYNLNLAGFIVELFGRRQAPYVYGWLQAALQAQEDGTCSPGQVLALVGAHGCGKTLFQQIVTEVLQVQSSNACRYAIGNEIFNDRHFDCGHLLLEFSDIEKRDARELASFIKSVTTNQAQVCNERMKLPVSKPALWRVTMALDGASNVLPLVGADSPCLADKIMVMDLHPFAVGKHFKRRGGKFEFIYDVKDALPDFWRFLKDWKISPGLACPRFGVKAFQNPKAFGKGGAF